MSHISGTARTARAGGGMIFGSAMMMVVGVFQVLMGIVALADRAFFFRPRASYTYRFNVHSWGIVHVIVGGVLLLAAISLLTGSRFARGIAVSVAAISAIANFFFIPYYPIWSVLIIAVDVFVIWQLANTPSQERMGTGSRMMDAGAVAGGDRWAMTNRAGYNAPDAPQRDMSSGQMRGDMSGQVRGDMSGQQMRGDMSNQMRGDSGQMHGDGQREQQPSSGRQTGGGGGGGGS
ncbi:hypothetical protein GCM10023322_20800 [Rugosimonospora acidiphila]|uniref:DUF7144 domain-containing protein n=1 Tax=Rugosimonospora acidiphila TaxID=556531 RepID=A0ABP9RNX4_9ACTN